MAANGRLFSDGTRRSKGNQARRYNLLAARLIAELIKNSLGPRGLEKMFVDVMGEVTVTKDGATLLRKIDVEHPAAKVIIEASNAVDNEVGDGTTSVVVLAGALVQKAEELLDAGISPSTISDGYHNGLNIALEALSNISKEYDNTDRQVMRRLAHTCVQSKVLSYDDKFAGFVVDAVCAIANFGGNSIDTDDIKIEEKEGSILDAQLVMGIVIDKTIDSSAMPRTIENAKIMLINDELEGKRTRADAEIRITSPDQIKSYAHAEALMIKLKVQHIIDSGANVVFSRKGINTLAQHVMTEAGIISVRRVKENDLLWLAKATGATISEKLDHDHEYDDHHEHGHDHQNHDHDDHYHHGDVEIKLGYAKRVYEKQVGDDKMIFVDGCKNPKAVTLLLRANSKKILDECHRSAIDAISVLRDFIVRPWVIAGGGASEAAIARIVREKASLISGREQIVVQKFAEALEEIPLTIARNAGMDVIDTLVQLRSRHSNCKASSYGVDAIERKVQEMLPSVIEPAVVKEQVIKTAVEVTNLLVRVDDVLMAKPAMYTHSHSDGIQHSHAGGDKNHQHDHFDRLGKQQRPTHHYY
ncbi:MAG TPA: TCP-1/cpn60 chaperonin family protein [Nitrososphaera sp.]|nr:TCP-1/cpn60 chaperonin family protein [Nitrososphaera sp.]